MGAEPAYLHGYDYTTCCECGIGFGSPILAIRRKDKGSVWCPNGHRQSWREGEADQLKKQLEEANRLLEWQRSQTATANHALERERRHAKKLQSESKRLKKRVTNGVCPCCNRTFENLLRHMETQHKDYKVEAHSA